MQVQLLLGGNVTVFFMLARVTSCSTCTLMSLQKTLQSVFEMQRYSAENKSFAVLKRVEDVLCKSHNDGKIV